MNQTVELSAGHEVLIRPVRTSDRVRVGIFLARLSEPDRQYLSLDLRDAFRTHRQRPAPAPCACVVAIVDHEIAAIGLLDRRSDCLAGGRAEVRLVVGRPWRRIGLGTTLARELFLMAAAERNEEISVRIGSGQTAARRIFQKLGFHEERTPTPQDRRAGGVRRDFFNMVCNLEALWRELETSLLHSDWQRAR